MVLISAPTLITTFDDTVDTSMFYSISEEESENFKLLLQPSALVMEVTVFDSASVSTDNYRFTTYIKPHLNLIFPPPEFI